MVCAANRHDATRGQPCVRYTEGCGEWWIPRREGGYYHGLKHVRAVFQAGNVALHWCLWKMDHTVRVGSRVKLAALFTRILGVHPEMASAANKVRFIAPCHASHLAHLVSVGRLHEHTVCSCMASARGAPSARGCEAQASTGCPVAQTASGQRVRCQLPGRGAFHCHMLNATHPPAVLIASCDCNWLLVSRTECFRTTTRG